MPNVVLAQVQEELGCVEENHTAATVQKLESLPSEFRDQLSSEALSTRLAGLIADSLIACANYHEWSDEQLLYAALFELSRVSQRAIRMTGVFSPEELEVIDQALTDPVYVPLWKQMGTYSAQSILDGSPPEADVIEEMIAEFTMDLDIEHSDEKLFLIGAFVAAVSMRQVAEQEFASNTN